MFLPLYFVFFVDATAFQLQIIGTTLCECFYLMSYVKSSLSSGTSYSCRQSAEKKTFYNNYAIHLLFSRYAQVILIKQNCGHKSPLNSLVWENYP